MTIAERIAESSENYALKIGLSPWLGRQDSNLRMSVPKTELKWPIPPTSLQKVLFVHSLESMT